MERENSQCINNYLHDYEVIDSYKGGLVELCTKCKDKRFFPEKIPPAIYLSYHARQLLTPKDRIFNREYKK